MALDKIGVVGQMHSGKTTVAKYLMERHGFERVAFADPVKDISAAMLTTMASYIGNPSTFDYDLVNSLKGETAVRKLLQLVGTELGREFFGPQDIWIRMFLQKVDQLDFNRIINDDCRFRNEAEALKKAGFTLIRVYRPEEQRIESLKIALRTADPLMTDVDLQKRIDETQNHPSETEQQFINPDYEITNDSDLDSLYAVVDDLVEGKVDAPRGSVIFTSGR